MSLVVELDPKTEEALKKKAAGNGAPISVYVRNLIEKDVEPTYEEVMAPVWKEFEESGMTEEELDEFVDGLRDEIWREKNGG